MTCFGQMKGKNMSVRGMYSWEQKSVCTYVFLGMLMPFSFNLAGGIFQISMLGGNIGRQKAPYTEKIYDFYFYNNRAHTELSVITISTFGQLISMLLYQKAFIAMNGVNINGLQFQTHENIVRIKKDGQNHESIHYVKIMSQSYI